MSSDCLLLSQYTFWPHILFNVSQSDCRFWFRLSKPLPFQKLSRPPMFNKHFIPLNVVTRTWPFLRYRHLKRTNRANCAFGREILRENHTSQNYSRRIVEFAVRYLNEEKANHRPLPENIHIARINYFYPSFEAEVAQHMKDRWKPFVGRKFKFDLFGAIKLGLKCTFWPFALMPIYVRTLRGHAKLEDFFAYAFVITIGLPYIFAPMWKTLFS